MSYKIFVFSFLCSIFCFLSIAPSAYAQSGKNLDALLSMSIEELFRVKVTAQKRTEDSSKVPIAMSVILDRDIQVEQEHNLEKLSSLDPSLTVRKGTTNRNSALFIRGVGTTAFSIATEPDVSTVIDGVVLARSGQAFEELYDVERIEVLRGPQGALFGKNASSGAVNIITKKPSSEAETNVRASIFQEDEYRINVSSTGAVTSNINARIAGFGARYDGNINNIYDGGDINGYDASALRSRVDWSVTEDLDLQFIMDFGHSNDSCCGEVIGTEPTNSSALLLLGGDTIRGDETRDAYHNLVTTTKNDSMGFSVQADGKINDLTLTSITGYRRWKNVENRDGDFLGDQASFLDTFQVHDYGDQTFSQFSQEIRLASNTDSYIDWLAGLFFWDIEADRNFSREDVVCIGSVLPVDVNGNTPCAVGSSTYERPAASANMSSKFKNYAAFGSVAWDMTDRWILGLGARATTETVSYKHKRVNTSGGLSGPGVRANDFSSTGEANETNLSLQSSLQYELSDNAMAYFSYKQGYKGPAYNVFFNMDDMDTFSIDAETSDNFELGYKYLSVDDNLSVNVAVFASEIENFQATSFDELNGFIVTRLTNAGKVVTSGLEFDVKGEVIDGMVLQGKFSYVDAKIRKFKCPGTINCASRKNEKLALSPDFAYMASVDYHLPLEKDYNIYLNSSYSWQDDMLSDSTDAKTKIEKHGVWDASVHYVSANKTHTLSLFAKNILDQSSASLITSGGPGGSYRYHIPRNADRYFGLSYNLKF